MRGGAQRGDEGGRGEGDRGRGLGRGRGEGDRGRGRGRGEGDRGRGRGRGRGEGDRGRGLGRGRGEGDRGRGLGRGRGREGLEELIEPEQRSPSFCPSSGHGAGLWSYRSSFCAGVDSSHEAILPTVPCQWRHSLWCGWNLMAWSSQTERWWIVTVFLLLSQ